MIEVPPSQRMRDIGVVQRGAEILAVRAEALALPAEREDAEWLVGELFAAMERIATAHDFSGKGMGLAAPQLGLGQAVAVVKPAGTGPIVLINPRITARSDESDEQYEGCLSFFDVRGMVSRPLCVTVETTAQDGSTVSTVYERGPARLVQHEIDHLEGILYTDRMGPGVEPIPVERYRRTGRAWEYQ
ncbi:peptide deformylase [Streptomyces sp. SBT349]|uniref:peptide deformylase n=1 Tax=Streptomyces sp. SBT349 TaxID=1580539 RepID=UPI00066BEDFA|nr:peptide deformylase [Streptomyces sp. SBT349]